MAWPTNLGWMMGPWLVFAALLNGATIALFQGSPLGRPFGELVQSAGVTMLGLVPSIAKAWRASDCMKVHVLLSAALAVTLSATPQLTLLALVPRAAMALRASNCTKDQYPCSHSSQLFLKNLVPSYCLGRLKEADAGARLAVSLGSFAALRAVGSVRLLRKCSAADAI